MDRDSEAKKAYYYKNRDTICAQRKEQYWSNPEKYRRANRKYWAENREAISVRRKIWYEANKEEILANARAKRKVSGGSRGKKWHDQIIQRAAEQHNKQLTN